MSEETLFHEALSKPPGERAAFLAAACAGKPELRAAVEALLAAHEAAENLLDRPPADLARKNDSDPGEPKHRATGEYTPEPAGSPPRPAATWDYHPDVNVGLVIAGRYTLVEKIGEGGMGEVWVAKQTTPVKRLVAVKLIKAGMDSRAVLARFDAERQALAVMDHPNIAKILDGGLHDNRPYFVMELVKGTPITRFCDARKLTPRQRLELFVLVCQAIQHAHQKGIIHRDIKPGNVHVALYDDRAVPKVIDFGVAKATGPQLTDASVYTAFGAIVGTPEYMSPEQASLNNLDIDTRSDVYALGVLLYELLTGTTPVDRKQLKDAAILEVLRVVREVEAPRPSTKLSSSEALASIAADRNTDPARLSALMKGELDWILLKALEKDRSRRYDSANGLAADIQRYLAGEPVQAVPPSTGYVLRKFVLRHKRAVVAAGLVLAAMLLGVFGVAFGMSGAERARLAEQTRDLLAGEKQQTDQARKEAESARDRLATEKDQTDKARKEAEDARDALKAAQENLARIEYGRTVQAAYQAWQDNNVPAALALLDSTRKDLRGWEWHYVHRLCHTDLITFKGTAASWSPDRTCVLTLSEEFQKPWGNATIWDARTGKVVLALKERTGPVRSAVFSPDGTRILTTGKEGSPKVWDSKTGAELFTLKDNTTQIEKAWWVLDGSRIVTDTVIPGKARSDAGIKVWDAKNGTELQTLKGHTNYVQSAMYSPDGSRIATTGGGGTILWDVKTGQEIVKMIGTNHQDDQWACFSPDSSRIVHRGHIDHLIDGGKRQTVQVMDTKTGTVVSTLKLDGLIVMSAAFSPDSARVVTGIGFYNHTAVVWDAKTGAALLTLKGHSGQVESVSYRPNGAQIVTGSMDRTARVWDATTGELVRIIKGQTAPIRAVSFTPDGKQVVTESVDFEGPNSTISVWDARSTAEVLVLQGHAGHVHDAAFSPDGRRLATAGGLDSTARIWDATTGATLHTLADKLKNFEGIVSVSWNPEGSRLVTGGADGTAQVWDAKTGAKLFSLGTGDMAEIGCSAWSPDGSRIAIGRQNKEGGELYDAKTGAKLRDLPNKGWGWSVAFSPDSTRLAIGTDVGTYVFNTANGAKLLVLNGHAREVAAVSFSPDGSRIVTGSGDRTAKVWDAKSGALLLTLKGHTGPVTSAKFSPDGSRILTGNEDHTAKIWDATTGADLLTLKGHTEQVKSASWSPGGWRIVTGSVDKTARIWDARALKAESQPKDRPARFKITSKRNDDRVEVRADQDKTLFTVKSPFGISQAVIEKRQEDAWPKAVVLRLHLKGLSKLQASNGKATIDAAVSSQDGKMTVRVWKDGKEDMPLDKKNPLWMGIRIVGGDGKPARELPLKDGYFEMNLPRSFFEGNPRSITVSWIDFYRN
jgi:WD40 repeat protein